MELQPQRLDARRGRGARTGSIATRAPDARAPEEITMDTHAAFPSFAVPDLDAALGFYRDTLDMDARIDGEDPMRMLTIQLATGSHILVYPKSDHEPAGYTVLNLP